MVLLFLFNKSLCYTKHGREVHPVVDAAFKAVRGCVTAFGGFDTHSLSPFALKKYQHTIASYLPALT